MLSRVASTLAIAVACLSAIALAVPTGDHHDDNGDNNCNTGPVQCCNSVQPAGNADASKLLALVGVVVQDLTVPVGLTCNPVEVIGIGGNHCSSQPVCCEDNSFNGVIAIGCSPINVNL